MDARHPKRSFLKHRPVDSPTYDASEEDNDPLTDDGASVTSIPSPVPRTSSRPGHLAAPKSSRPKHQLAASLTSASSDGVDSPTYDGDIESSTTVAGRDRTLSSAMSVMSLPAQDPPESTPSASPAPDDDAQPRAHTTMPPEPAPAQIAKDAFDPAKLTLEDIQSFVKRAVDGDSTRRYAINKPPTDRPIRIYADGVYDLFHFGHALQLRQAKLAFPSVYLLVGACSDELVRSHKNPCVMTHAERCEAIRHCRWVDQVVPEAPWVITPAFLEKYQIDYVAHDEDPYAGAGHDDVYAAVKAEGKFLPTRRTPGVSTSELLERIVKQYRHRDFDNKLEKLGAAHLKAEGSDYDDDPDGPRSRAVSRVRGRKEQLKQDAKHDA